MDNPNKLINFAAENIGVLIFFGMSAEIIPIELDAGNAVARNELFTTCPYSMYRNGWYRNRDFLFCNEIRTAYLY